MLGVGLGSTVYVVLQPFFSEHGPPSGAPLIAPGSHLRCTSPDGRRRASPARTAQRAVLTRPSHAEGFRHGMASRMITDGKSLPDFKGTVNSTGSGTNMEVENGPSEDHFPLQTGGAIHFH